eukprot:CAMPEP_0196741262 /NCGR_PEP_ID=MMETSP1091-20130531/38667_1 /TAXON_ID=302021 /ORGANISM="Rhodomonas sp., Strain CCMP768" /LENGTH=62 /DNA_ID=CAMNT_0042086855 /DNA_START=121 /DNA_END=309 /DNA_ORIENTATION=+
MDWRPRHVARGAAEAGAVAAAEVAHLFATCPVVEADRARERPHRRRDHHPLPPRQNTAHGVL